MGGTIIVAALLGLSILVNYSILNLQTFVSFGAVELLATLLYRFFISNKERERRVDELIEVASAIPRFSHLVYHFVDTGMKEVYPNAPRYILNEKTNSAFWVPAYIRSLAKERIIRSVEHETEKELYAFFESKRVILNKRYPIGNELSLGEGDRSTHSDIVGVC